MSLDASFPSRAPHRNRAMPDRRASYATAGPQPVLDSSARPASSARRRSRSWATGWPGGRRSWARASGRSDRRHGVQLHGRAVDAGDATVRLADGGALEVGTVIWATGFPAGGASTAHRQDVRNGGRASPPRRRGCGSCSIRRARHRALGKLDPGPYVHVDDDADDLEHLLRAEVLDEGIVERWNAASRSVSAARVSASV